MYIYNDSLSASSSFHLPLLLFYTVVILVITDFIVEIGIDFEVFLFNCFGKCSSTATTSSLQNSQL